MVRDALESPNRDNNGMLKKRSTTVITAEIARENRMAMRKDSRARCVLPAPMFCPVKTEIDIEMPIIGIIRMESILYEAATPITANAPKEFVMLWRMIFPIDVKEDWSIWGIPRFTIS